MNTTYAFSQVLTGRILDDEDGSSVSFATIFIKEIEHGTIADENGRFKLSLNGLKKITLQISSVGYVAFEQHIDLGQTNDFEFRLVPKHLQLDEVIVSIPGGKLGEEHVVNIEAVSMKLLNESSPLTLASAIAMIPGVDQLSTGSAIGKPVIRGLTGNRLVVYSQNIRIENQQFGSEHGLGESAIGVERVEVIKGPASLLYGADALGGVLYLVDEKYAKEDKLEGFVSSGYQSNTQGINNNLGLKLNKNHLKWNLFSGHNSNADYKVPNGNRVFNTRFSDFSIKSALGYHRKNWLTNVRYSYLNNAIGIPEGAKYSTSTSRTPVSPFQDISQHILSLENVFYFGEHEVSFILGMNQNDRKEFEEHIDPATMQSEEELALHMILKTFTFNIKSKNTFLDHLLLLTSGVQGMHQSNENRGEELLIPDGETNDIGLYSVLNYDNLKGLDVQGGVRVDNRNIQTAAFNRGDKDILSFSGDYQSFNFSLGATRTWNRVTLRANLASGFRPPSTAELLAEGVHHGALKYEKGNRRLVSERGFQVDLSTKLSSEHLQLTVNPFYNRINDYIYLNPTGESIDGYLVYQYEQTNAELFGGEIMLHYHPHQIHWLHLESEFSSVTANDNQGNALSLIPSARINSKAKVVIEDKGKVQFTHFFVSSTYKFAQNRVAAEEEETSQEYFLLHLGADLLVPMSPGSLNITFGISNLLNTYYIDHLSRLKADGIPNQGRNFNFSVKWNWMTK